MKNINKILSAFLVAMLLASMLSTAFSAGARAINSFSITTDCEGNGINVGDNQITLTAKFDVGSQYGFVGGDFLLELPDELNSIESITPKAAISLNGITPINTNLVLVAINDNTVRFIVDDAKQSCSSISFEIKLNVVSQITTATLYKISVTAPDGAFKDDHSHNDEIVFDTQSNSLNIHLHDNDAENFTCTVCGKFVGKSVPTPPNAPIRVSSTDTSVTLKSTSGYEYRVDNGEWQSKSVFKNLEPDTYYTFYQRIAESDLNYASEASAGLKIKTKTIEEYHSLVPVSAINPSCDSVGVKAHDKCEDCGNLYIGGVNVTEQDVIIATLPHNIVQMPQQSPTCTEIGWSAYEYCTKCDYTTYEKISALGHTKADAVKENELAATCTKAGSYDSVVYCEVCEAEISRDVISVDAIDHSYTPVEEIPAKTGIAGTAAHDKCDVCGKLFVDGEEVEASELIIPALPEYAEGWKTGSKGWWYQYADGSYAVGWKQIKSVWYYFDTNGWMQTGWEKIKGVWYYFNADGVMQTDWEKIKGVWYYFNADGAMQTDWEKIKGVWYYFNADGAMQTGWEKIKGVWYYFNADGVMQTGWEKIGGKWYYFNTSGAMLSNTSRNIGGKVYHFNASGVCTNP